MSQNFKFFQLLMLCAMLFMSACASSNTADENGGVQDIQPGEESVIQPPASLPSDSARQIEERNI